MGAAIGVALLAGCDNYPPAEDVAACAAASLFSATEYTITYQKAGSPDRALVIHYRRKGPVTTQVDISYGNHAEIAGAVEAIKYCAQPR